MQSAAQVFGARTTGIILTGMGDDGTMGLLEVQSKGGRTYVQDAESCVVNGMPQRALEKGVVDFVAPPRRIAELVAKESKREQS
jgi:two-component system chemotaxis response regulator CheB